MDPEELFQRLCEQYIQAMPEINPKELAERAMAAFKAIIDQQTEAREIAARTYNTAGKSDMGAVECAVRLSVFKRMGLMCSCGTYLCRGSALTFDGSTHTPDKCDEGKAKA